jgi:hypothetical protein
MSDFYSPAENRKASKNHKCTYCAEIINKGELYSFQKGNYDGEWFESKMHHECFDELIEDGEGEYMPYSNERPKTVSA